MGYVRVDNQLTREFTDLDVVLNNIYDSVKSLDTRRLTHALHELQGVRCRLGDEDSFLRAQSFVRRHRTFSLLLEDPYTHHAFTKPRGFAGDASMIDLLYGHRSGSEAASDTGRLIFETLMRFPSSDAVRFRRGYYGAFIDRVSSRQGEKSDVLAIACGHLREAKFSRAVTDGAVNLTGIDSDPLAVAEAQRSIVLPNVTVRNASVIDFVRRKAWGETYDGIYAAGLFDYLDVRIGRKVVETAFNALRPGGTLSVANYLPTIVEQGYMDLVMDWRLIYRTSADMLALATNLPQDQADMMVWTDPLDAVVYLTVTKRG